MNFQLRNIPNNIYPAYQSKVFLESSLFKDSIRWQKFKKGRKTLRNYERFYKVCVWLRRDSSAKGFHQIRLTKPAFCFPAARGYSFYSYIISTELKYDKMLYIPVLGSLNPPSLLHRLLTRFDETWLARHHNKNRTRTFFISAARKMSGFETAHKRIAGHTQAFFVSAWLTLMNRYSQQLSFN